DWHKARERIGERRARELIWRRVAEGLGMLRVGLLGCGLSAVAALGLSGFAASAANVAPKVDTSRPTPVVYPAQAQRAGEEGTVLLNVYVTWTGKPQKI